MEVFGFGISGPELLVILLVMLLVLGPKQMAQGIRALGRGINAIRRWSARLRESSQGDVLGLSEVDWSEYDPRKLDPRVMIRDAVQEEMDAWMKQMSTPPKPSTQPTSPVEDDHPTPENANVPHESENMETPASPPVTEEPKNPKPPADPIQ